MTVEGCYSDPFEAHLVNQPYCNLYYVLVLHLEIMLRQVVLQV